MIKKIIILSVLFSIITFPQTFSKKGGICFRIDDNHTMEKYTEYASRFNKYGKNFCFALNLGREEFNSDDYINGVKQLQASGHELMDHTPEHRTSFFNTKFDISLYSTLSGVDHIVENKICLKYADVNITKAKRSGYVDIDGNKIISKSKEFKKFLNSERYLYFPELANNKLVTKKEIISDSLMVVNDPWLEKINLGKHSNIKYYSFTSSHIHMSIQALNVLAKETQKLADLYEIIRPVTWIQPGVSTYYTFPYVYAQEIKQSYGVNFNYVAAAVYPYTYEKTYKVFNEYDRNLDKRFGMQWGDFNNAEEQLQITKEKIANKIAKHYVLIGHSHFTKLLGGWDAYLERVDSLLAWAVRNSIPVRTYKEWADILYSQIPNPKENIFPPLNVDLDQNGMPDGYDNFDKLKLDKTDGVPDSNYSLVGNSTGNICTVKGLGGIEKGENNFEIWTKGSQGNFIEINFKIGKTHSIYKLPAESSEWTKYNLTQSINGDTSLNIPESISLIDITISCSDYTSGVVKISGMKLYKSSSTQNLIVSPHSINVNADSGDTNFSISSNVDWTIANNNDWVKVYPISGNGNKNISISIKPNPDSLNRTAIISILGEGLTENLSVIQNGLDVYNISLDKSPREACDIFGGGNFLEGSNVTVTCTPHTNWKFDYWSENEDTVSMDSVYSFIIDRSHSFIANLSPITSIKNSRIKVPKKYSLSQNYPNPFNPTTKITFGLPVKADVELKIYNLLGQELMTLVNKEFSAGIHSIDVNAGNLSSGVYIYSISAISRNGNNFISTKKMILIR